MSGITSAFIVPGLPHLASESPGWETLKAAMRNAAARAQAAEPDVLVLYSAQWISVLGHSFQADPNPRGVHVDDNWYDMGDFEFDFRVDVDLARRAEQCARDGGFATKLIHYEGFPVDTGTLVALRYFNPDNRLPVVIVSANIYASAEDSYRLGEAVGEAIRASGRRAALINCSSLSHRFHTRDIRPEEDEIAGEGCDAWNRRMLDLIQSGDTSKTLAQSTEYVRAAGPEMQFKGFHWLMGALGGRDTPGEVLAYGPLWGTGAAVVQYSLEN